VTQYRNFGNPLVTGKTSKVNYRYINNNITANIKDKNLKVYNDVYGRMYTYHTTKTAKIKKEGDITLQHIARMSM